MITIAMRASYTRILPLAALLLALPGTAFANGDPASDVLLTQPIYFPSIPVTKSVAEGLKKASSEAKQAGAPIDVALIAAPEDLGAVPDFFGRPQEYAKFLSGELKLFQKRNPLLIVMPAGFGTVGFKPGAERRLTGVKVSSDADPDDLAKAAAVAVQELAAAQGHPIKEVVSKDSLGGGGGGGSGVIIGLAVLLAFAAAAGIALRLRAGRAQGSGQNEGDV
jgi:hypothetical protein